MHMNYDWNIKFLVLYEVYEEMLGQSETLFTISDM